MSFTRLGLAPAIVSALESLNYHQPTEIQQKAIPAVLSGRNLLAVAQTGTGKTAAFGLPLIERLSQGKTQRKKRVRAVILAPTRELVLQVAESLTAYAGNLPLTVLAMYGGVDIQPQKQALIDGIDILVATPGRLKDMYYQRAVYFEEIRVLVLDEADRMLDMGFIEVINELITRMPESRQNLLFSATLSPRIRELAKTAVPDPIEIATAKPSKKEIAQWLVTVDKDAKSALLSHLIQTQQWRQALIFIETKHGAAKLVSQLAKRGIKAEAFHSGRSQAVREQLLADFKDGKLQYLIATGVAARGIDVDKLERVVNYDLPFPADEYIHRIGRTGRAGMTGEAVSLLSKDDFKCLCMIESRLGHLIERRVIAGFEPTKPVPVSILNYQPKSRVQRPKVEIGNFAAAGKRDKHPSIQDAQCQPGRDANRNTPANAAQQDHRPGKSEKYPLKGNRRSSEPKSAAQAIAQPATQAGKHAADPWARARSSKPS